MTITGLLPPMLDTAPAAAGGGCDLLVDGGYVNNLPVDVMRYVFLNYGSRGSYLNGRTGSEKKC